MRTVRIAGALLALLIVADFSASMWLDADPVDALLPALFGALVMALLSLRDAATPRHRKLVFYGTIFLTICLAASLGVMLGSHLPWQIALAAMLLLAAASLAFRAYLDSRRRRYHAIGHYLTGYGPG